MSVYKTTFKTDNTILPKIKAYCIINDAVYNKASVTHSGPIISGEFSKGSLINDYQSIYNLLYGFFGNEDFRAVGGVVNNHYDEGAAIYGALSRAYGTHETLYKLFPKIKGVDVAPQTQDFTASLVYNDINLSSVLRVRMPDTAHSESGLINLYSYFGNGSSTYYPCAFGGYSFIEDIDFSVNTRGGESIIDFNVFPSSVINSNGKINLSDTQNCAHVQIYLRSFGGRFENRLTIFADLRPVSDYPDYAYFTDVSAKLSTGDPYNDGDGVTETGGGSGTFDGSSDSVDFPALPTFSAVDTGFVTLFNPSLKGLKDLAHFLWSDLIGSSFEQTLNALKRVVSDPMDAILSLHVVPVPVPSSGSRNVGIYDIVSTVSLPLASTQYVILDCGTLNVKEFWGAYLDYSPYTKIEIYLPYIGIESLNIDDVMNKPVHVKYYIDLLTGGCVAFVKCGNSVLYQFSGSCALPIPFNSVNYTNTITGILSAAASIGGTIASGGLSAPLSAVGAAASLAQGAANAAQMASSSKPNVKKSGTMGGATGFLGIQKPYLILTRPRQAVAGFQNIYEGYPTHITSKLSDVHGFAQMEVLVADGLSCSEPEKNEIVSLLESGVYLP